MFKVFLLFVLLFSCATPAATLPQSKEVRNMDYRLLNLEYEFYTERCFLYFEICKLKKDQKCFPKHEQCVIDQHKRYQHLLRLRGFEKGQPK